MDNVRSPEYLYGDVLKPSIKVVKTFPYRGGTQQFSNRYHFDGHTGLTAAEWLALETAIQVEERPALRADAHITEYVGYEAGSEVPVYSHGVSVAGTFPSDANDAPAPGDCVGLVRWATTQRTSKNHPIYLYNYYHAAWYDHRVSADAISENFHSALANLAQLWKDGIALTGGTVVRCGPNGAVGQSFLVKPYLTHRDFPR